MKVDNSSVWRRDVEKLVQLKGFLWWMGGGEKGEAGVWLVHMVKVIHVASYEIL